MFLDCLELALKDIGVRFERLDGSQTIAQRSRAVETFKTVSTCDCLLLSLKAGGLGLNLVEANVVILCDPWWAAAPELQAIGRCYRFGQKRPVTVKRLIATRSVEQKILEIQERKLKVGSAALGFDLGGKEFIGNNNDDNDNTPNMDEEEDLSLMWNSSKITLDDLKSLFVRD
jgi:SNF2 family DNA or RNA helicase